jgi:hypothetical protein
MNPAFLVGSGNRWCGTTPQAMAMSRNGQKPAQPVCWVFDNRVSRFGDLPDWLLSLLELARRQAPPIDLPDLNFEKMPTVIIGEN